MKVDNQKEDKQKEEKKIVAVPTDRKEHETHEEEQHPLLRELDYALALEPEQHETHVQEILEKAKALAEEHEAKQSKADKTKENPAESEEPGQTAHRDRAKDSQKTGWDKGKNLIPIPVLFLFI